MNNKSILKVLLWVSILFGIYTVASTVMPNYQTNSAQISYSQFLKDAKDNKIAKVVVEGDQLSVTPRVGEPYAIVNPGDLWMVDNLVKQNVQVIGKSPEKRGVLFEILISWFPMIILVGVYIFFMRQMQGGGGKGGAFGFGKSKARRIDSQANKVTFNDIAGCDEAKEDVKEIVDYLKEPKKYERLGGHVPRGVLMVGPPGTGKTLLAKAIAGEAKVPFFTISGSDFVEMFVGVGASRVRDMFQTAKKNAPCIIFVDEIDAVGRHRGAGHGGGNDEREQTLNQMLVEMDGFESGESVIVIAATNRPDVLDQALLRPGRFDRQVQVGLPDVRGREQILKVHMKKVPLSPNVDPTVIARGTPGFSGADLANLVNEAALFAARRKGRLVDMIDLEQAKDKLIMGAERKSMIMPEEERKNTAYHESGHAIVARMLPKTDPVHKVTIIPRGRALGVTMQLPETDRYSMDKERILNDIAVLFGGRIAEEVFMNQMTTGASNDFERATKLARNLVTKYGMDDEMGVMVYVEPEDGNPYGRGGQVSILSEATMQKIDAQIRKILDEQYHVARKIIEDHQDKMHKMAGALLKWETIDMDQIDDIMAGKDPRPPKEPEAPYDAKLSKPSDEQSQTAKEIEVTPSKSTVAENDSLMKDVQKTEVTPNEDRDVDQKSSES